MCPWTTIRKYQRVALWNLRATLAAEEEEDETLIVTVTDPAVERVVEEGDEGGKAGVKVEATLTF